MGLSAKTAVGSIILAAIIFAPLGAYAQTSSNCNVSGGVNNGIIFQNCGTVYAVPAPTYDVVEVYPIKKNDDGTYTRSVLIRVDAPYPPGNILLAAKGDSVKDLQVQGVDTMGMMNVLWGASPDGWHYYRFSTPWGKYQVNITTTDSTTPATMIAEFNVN